MQSFFRWINKNQNICILLLRLFIGIWLIFCVQENIQHWPHMLKFRVFLQQFHLQVSLISVVVSVYTQFLPAVLIMLGWKIRFAALVAIVYFAIAWLLFYRHGNIKSMTPALAILCGAILFLFKGRRRFSIDKNKFPSNLI